MEDKPRRMTPEAFTDERWEKEYLDAVAKSEDWSKRLLTSLALANGAGLAAIASTLPEAGDPKVWQMQAAQAFAVGMAAAGAAMFFRERFWAAKIYRFAWLAREPERFPGDVQALATWTQRPWWQKPFRPATPHQGVDPRHPALLAHWRSTRWDFAGELSTFIAAAAFFTALAFAVLIRAT